MSKSRFAEPDVPLRRLQFKAARLQDAVRALKAGWLTTRFRPDEVDGVLSDTIDMLPKSRVRFVYNSGGSWVQFNDAEALRYVVTRLQDWRRDLKQDEQPADPKVTSWIATISKATLYTPSTGSRFGQ